MSLMHHPATEHVPSHNACDGLRERDGTDSGPWCCWTHALNFHGDHITEKMTSSDTVLSDASPIEWERLTGAPLDTEDNLSFVLLAAPTFAGTEDFFFFLDH